MTTLITDPDTITEACDADNYTLKTSDATLRDQLIIHDGQVWLP